MGLPGQTDHNNAKPERVPIRLSFPHRADRLPDRVSPEDSRSAPRVARRSHSLSRGQGRKSRMKAPGAKQCSSSLAEPRDDHRRLQEIPFLSDLRATMKMWTGFPSTASNPTPAAREGD